MLSVNSSRKRRERTLGTGFSMRLLKINPISDVTGRWLEIFVSDSAVRLTSVKNPENSVVLVTNDTTEPVYVNLDALEDLSEISKPTLPKEKGGCNSSNGSPSLPATIFILLFLSLLRRRKTA